MPSTFEIRPLESRDRASIARIVESVGNFSAEEIRVALELVDAWLSQGEASEYICDVIEEKQTVRGYVCFGPTPLTEGTFDLYWIAVERSSHGKGYGQALLEHAEQQAKRRGGRIVLIETASQNGYAGTIEFYKRAGYGVVSRIPDFYRVGDDKLTFWKRIH
ncbi:MAG TPA: N-acetyltransferase [Gemmatimonadaceae bacterium]|nr:N-acetyltransferase [Gemmatimonadaceae bacterium]